MKYHKLPYSSQVNTKVFLFWLTAYHWLQKMIIHPGVRTKNSKSYIQIYKRLNPGYSKDLRGSFVKYGMQLIFARMALTYYEQGETGPEDSFTVLPFKHLLNLSSGNNLEFDSRVLEPDDKLFYSNLFTIPEESANNHLSKSLHFVEYGVLSLQ